MLTTEVLASAVTTAEIGCSSESGRAASPRLRTTLPSGGADVARSGHSVNCEVGVKPRAMRLITEAPALDVEPLQGADKLLATFPAENAPQDVHQITPSFCKTLCVALTS